MKSILFMKGNKNAKFDSKWMYSLHISVLKFEIGPLFRVISLSYSIYLSKSLPNSLTPREKERGGTNWRGGR